MAVRRPLRLARLVDRNGAKIADLSLLNGTVSADEGWAPYAQAQLVIVHPGLTTLARLDPTARVSIQLELAADDAAYRAGTFGATQLFTIPLAARRVRPDGTVALSLMSGEQYLQDYKMPWTVEDISLWANQSSLRSIVYNILNRALGAGFALDFDALDQTFNTFSELTNLIENPSFEIANAEGWTPANCDVERATDWAAIGNYSGRINPKGTTVDTYASADPGMGNGRQYTLTATFRNGGGQSGTLSDRARRMVVVATVNGSARVIATSAPASTTPYANERLAMTFRVPVNAQSTEVRLYNGSYKTGEVVYWDAVMLTEGNQRDTNNLTTVPYFDGDTANSSAYAYQWDGDRSKSTSTRVPLLDRPPESLTWSPGQSAWDLLTGILNAANQRLYADLTNRFHLVDNSYRADYRMARVAYGDNLYDVSELTSRTASQPDGTPLYADGVLVRYQWRDRNGVERERLDYAGPSSPQKLYETTRPNMGYPGPKGAAWILARLQARRVMLDVLAAEDFEIVPSRPIEVTLKPGEVWSGQVAAVDWNLDNAEMTVTTKGLVTL
jgi:mRNA-degrading endonuclease toxin of MazEF toxin-antitoxin module